MGLRHLGFQHQRNTSPIIALIKQRNRNKPPRAEREAARAKRKAAKKLRRRKEAPVIDPTKPAP